MKKEIMGRYDAFWKHEDTDRPILSISVRNREAAWEEYAPKTPYDKWENLETRYAWSRFCMDNTTYCGEAYPLDWVNFGPGCLAAMMGSDYVPDENTIWFGRDEIFIEDWDTFDELSLVENSNMYKMVMDMTRILAERNNNNYNVGISDLGGNLDVLASLRGTMNLLTDIYDYPDRVQKAVDEIDKVWKMCYSNLRNIIGTSGQKGHCTWLGIWCETTYYPLQCDFAAMISPDAFGKFVMPSLVRCCDFLDHSLFHLDGPDMIVHLDQLLSIPRLNGIQWVPGDGSPTGWDEIWFPMYEKIQAAGKNLVINVDTADNVLKICRNLSPKGLMISTNLDSVEEAEELLANVTKLYSR